MIRAAILTLLLWPAAVVAQPVAVRSGEHADFSRLVIEFAPVPEWVLGRVAGGYELRPSEPGEGYDLGRVYDLIPRTRLASIEPRADGRLFFRVDCDCTADAFEIRNGLVIDIKDGPPDRSSRFETALAPQGPPNAGDTAVSDASPAPTSTASPVPAPLGTRFQAERTKFAWAGELALDLGQAPAAGADAPMKPDMQGDAAPPHDRVADVQQELIAQIGRAAVQGLVTADLSDTEARVENARPTPEMAGPDLAAATGAMAELTEAVQNGHVRFETAVDRGRAALAAAQPMTTEGTGCLDGEKFNIAAWGTPLEPGGSLSLARSAIMGEFDAADAQGIEALAKHYIYLTFGAEARALLSTFEPEIEGAALLRALGDIMDYGTTQAEVIPGDQMACDSRAALWAVLAAPALSKSDRIARDAVLSAFGELPLHLRRHIGPYLADRLLQAGDADSATAIRDSIARAPGDPGMGFQMMDAQILLESGQRDAGAGQLADIIRADGPLAPEAVVRLIDLRLGAAEPLPPGISETAAALAFEARGTQLGAELLRAQSRALAHGGDILGALETVEKSVIAGNLPADAATLIRQEVLALATADANDEVFLQVALTDPPGLGARDAAPAVRRGMAARLIELGMTRRARDILSEGAQPPTMDDRLLLARSFLQDRRPDLAMGYLAGLDDTEANELRANALALAGEYGRAARVFETLGDAEARARSSWRGGDWRTVADIGPATGQAAAELATRPEPADAGTGTLATNRRLLGRSQEARQVLAELLANTAKP